ncbi:serine/threonine protein kinase [Pseudomonas aeruginosa VRFPA01]|nr:serine/threonine protein kinase [Pseudomonas aeruginosa VRFPA01]
MDIELPGFDIERELGEGAMATVYLATQRSLQRKVALKVMAAALAADPSFAERFLREGRTLARLSHPNTVTIHDIGNVGSCYYMAMEYLPNGTLKERIQQGLDPELGLAYVRQVAAALGYAHSQGLVHRDVKPANILFRADGTAVLSDFGIAKSIEDNTQFTQVGFAVGTPSYMSPEQARGQEIDGRADLYALGVVLYEILTGKLPYNGKDSLSTALAHLTEPLPELPIEQGRYQDILRQLLAKDPAERFPTAGALIAALDRLAPSAGQGGASGAASDTFRTGIVLVVDTSVSMQPYIDRVREVIDGLQRQIGERGDLDKVSFGLVGFRNNTDKTPGLEYVSKTLVPLQPGNDAQRFAELSSQVRATDVSSHSFNEDTFAGIMQAVDEMDWSPYAGRVVLLVTDAGALRKNDPLGRTQMNEAEVRQAALRKGVKIYALHLRTPAGKNNHGYAEQQYRSLTADANPKIADLYIPVAGGEVNAFGNTVKEIGTVFADLVHDAGNRKPQAPRFDAAPSVASKSAAIGYAMQMEFLGRRDPVRAPQVVTAWTADRDLTNPALPAFQVCVLLSKLQLNELQQSLKLIVDAAKRTQTSPKDFFQEIASASAYMSRDPAQLVKGSNLAQSGVLGEYLEGLPYRSKSLNMTQDLWLSLSVAEQQDFIDELESKIRLYETFHNDVANWVRFGDADAGDALYRVPLSTLP